MHKFISIVLAFLIALVVAFIGMFVASQYVDSTDVCTVTSTAEIEVRERRKAYRINTAECGTFSVSAVPLRGIDAPDAMEMFDHVNLGERYTITYITEGFGVFSVNPSVIDIQPAN